MSSAVKEERPPTEQTESAAAFDTEVAALGLQLDALEEENAQDAALYDTAVSTLTEASDALPIADSQAFKAEPVLSSTDDPKRIAADTSATTPPSLVSPVPAAAAGADTGTGEATDHGGTSQTPAPKQRITASPARRPTPGKSKKSGATTSGTKRASSGGNNQNSPETKKQALSWNDILRVQNLIERCLQQYLSKDEIVVTLKTQAKVDPSFTAIVWQKLEEQNPSFFKAYGLQLQLKEQLVAFNYLVAQQKEMMAKQQGVSAAMLSPFPSSSSSAAAASSAAGPTLSVETARPTARSVPATGNPLALCDVRLASTAATHPTWFRLAGSSSFLMSPLPLPSPIKNELDTHAFFT
ncbi:hypothetical protein ATCC90586_003676 [Pythium insidiosum]|nr:hypothetical protein ATCC90586_003676 [Pythium insidiosum]